MALEDITTPEHREIARQRDEIVRLRAALDACHLAVGEDPASDDETLAEGIALRIAELEVVGSEIRKQQKCWAEETECVRRERDKAREEIARLRAALEKVDAIVNRKTFPETEKKGDALAMQKQCNVVLQTLTPRGGDQPQPTRQRHDYVARLGGMICKHCGTGYDVARGDHCDVESLENCGPQPGASPTTTEEP